MYKHLLSLLVTKKRIQNTFNLIHSRNIIFVYLLIDIFAYKLCIQKDDDLNLLFITKRTKLHETDFKHFISVLVLD